MSGWAGIKKELFGDYIEIVIHTDEEKKGKKILKEAYQKACYLEKIFNFYDGSSEINKLNKQRTLKSSNQLLEIITLAKEFGKETNGLYDITKGLNFLQRKRGLPLQTLSCSYQNIDFHENTITLTHKDALIDVGSIAKGYIADKVGEFLKSKEIADFVIDARGDILLSGNATPLMHIKHPRKEGHILTIHPKDCGIATSGDYHQYDKTHKKSHILNQNKYVSVTIIAKTLTKADLFATLFSIVDSKKMKELLQKNPDVCALTIDNKLKKEYHNNFKEVANQ